MHQLQFPGSGLKKAASAFGRNTTGATSIEYALIATAISVAIIGVVTNLGSTLNTMYFNEVRNGLE